MTATETKLTGAEALASAMALWQTIRAAAERCFPNASEEELYRICSNAMNSNLKIK